jgi:ketosteroid isomerase-like protein
MRQLAPAAALVLIALLVAAAGCGRQASRAIPADLGDAIDAFYAAIEAGDHEAHIACFGDSAIMMPNHWTRYEGRDAIAQVIRSGEGSIFRLRDREIIDMDAGQDLAYTVNSYLYTYHPEGGQPRWHRTKNVHIWKRDSRGRWELHVDIWNSDVPMEEFPDE